MLCDHAIVAMIDPGAGAGAGLIRISVQISLITLLVHFVSDRFFTICFSAAAILFAIVFASWVWLDVLDPNGGDRWAYSAFLLPWAFILPLVGSAVAGLPAVVFRCWYRSWSHPQRDNGGG